MMTVVRTAVFLSILFVALSCGTTQTSRAPEQQPDSPSELEGKRQQVNTSKIGTSSATTRPAGSEGVPVPRCAPDFCDIHLAEPGWVKEPCACPDGQIRKCGCKGTNLPEGEYCPCRPKGEIQRCSKPRIDCKNRQRMPGAPCMEYVEPVP